MPWQQRRLVRRDLGDRGRRRRDDARRRVPHRRDAVGHPATRLDFSPGSGWGRASWKISPQIEQTFWIGDGLTGDGDGSRQRINVPARATRLFVGFADASAFTGPPCCYNDNLGGYKATIFIGRSAGPPGPDPQANRSGTGSVSSGRVFVTRNGRRTQLRDGQRIPVGSTVDTRAGSLVLRVADGKGGVQTGTFSKGVFRFTQAREKVVSPAGTTLNVLTTRLNLVGGNFKSCPAPTRAGPARRRAVRFLQAKASGRFRVVGRQSSGIERGTAWTTSDRCEGTETKVTKGTVIVTDFALKRDIVVMKGQTYLARRPA